MKARGLLFLVPFLLLWVVAFAYEKRVGFASAAAQNLPPRTTITNPENPTTEPPSTTYMPSTSKVGEGFPDPTNGTPNPQMTRVTTMRNGVHWTCAPNAGVPGTHCWDP